MATRSPKTRPVWPRVSSAMSGLRFWGMMLLPVGPAGGRTKPNSSSTTGRSPRRGGRGASSWSRRRRGFHHEVAVANGVHAVAGDADEAEFLGYGLAIERVRSTGERTGPRRQLFAGARHYTGEPDGIPVEHLEICEQVVSQEDRLGTLEVGVAWKDSTDVLLGEVKEDTLEDAEPGIDTADARGFDNREANIGGDLVVAGAGGVEAGAGVADLLTEGASRC